MSVSFPTKCFLFTNLSCLALEIFRFFKACAKFKTLQNNLASWDLEMGFNSLFKGLMLYCSLTHHKGMWMNGGNAPLVFNLSMPQLLCV
jgi:hypothetical protein